MPQLPETTIFVIFATYCKLSKAKAAHYSHCQQISAGKDRAKIRTIKKQRGKRMGKRVAYHLVLCHWFDFAKKIHLNPIYSSPEAPLPNCNENKTKALFELCQHAVMQNTSSAFSNHCLFESLSACSDAEYQQCML